MTNRIILTGAHGTGKTTVLNMFEKAGWSVITEVVRRLNKDAGVKINEDGDSSGQHVIFDTYKELLQQDKYVSDRGLTDVIAYTKYLCDTGKLDHSLFEEQLDTFKKFHDENPDILYCFFPIEFDIEDDNVRSTAKDFQKRISDNIRWIISEVGMTSNKGIDFITVSGTPEKRFQTIIEAIELDI